MAIRKMTFSVPEPLAAQFLRRVIRACEAANAYLDVAEIEKEFDALGDELPNELPEPWKYELPLSSSPKASPPILVPRVCDGQPVVAVSDQIRAVAKERLRGRLGVVSEEELAAHEDALRQVMQLG